MAYHRSRSRGVGDRIIRRRKSLESICHCSRNRSISLTPITDPSLTPRRLTQLPYNFTPCFCVFHLGFGLVGCRPGLHVSHHAGLRVTDTPLAHSAGRAQQALPPEFIVGALADSQHGQDLADTQELGFFGRHTATPRTLDRLPRGAGTADAGIPALQESSRW